MKRVAIVAAAVLASLTIDAAEARARVLFGFNDTPETFAREAPMAEAARARVARIAVSWETVERQPGRYDWSQLDAAVGALEAREISQLLAISAAPPWAAPECELLLFMSCGVGAEHLPDYVGFATALLDRYPGSRVQSWNEPNLPQFGDMAPAWTARLTRAADRAAPGRVIGPAAGPAEPRQWNYLENVYRQLPETIPMAVHLYPRSGFFAGGGLEDYWRRAERIAGGRPVWVTEVGFAESEYGADGQARKSVRALVALARAGARAVIVHRLRDEHFAWSAWLSSLGVLAADGAPKPAYEALRRAASDL